MSATLQLLGLAALGFVLLSSLVVTAFVPRLLRATAAWGPASRHHALRWLGVAPLLATAVALLSAVTPSLLALAWPASDHCAAHDGHAHLCLIHGAGEHGGRVVWLLLAAGAAWVSVGLGHELRRLVVGRRVVRRLLAHARYDRARDAWIVPTAQPLCVSVGVFRPRLVLSRGLLESASASELAVMVAHEAAHGARRDALARLVVRLATVVLPRRAREPLRAALELAAERACDERAAAAVGDRLRVAETLLAMERRLAAPDGALITAFGGSALPERVEALLADPPPTHPRRLAGRLALASAVVVLAAHDVLHHATESALAHLFH